jgi:hypothetical protein
MNYLSSLDGLDDVLDVNPLEGDGREVDGLGRTLLTTLTTDGQVLKTKIVFVETNLFGDLIITFYATNFIHFISGRKITARTNYYLSK